VAGQIAVLSSGVWQLREIVRRLTGLEPVRWAPPFRRPDFDCVVGWGLKPTSNRARRLAKKSGKNYLAMEDGFVRSLVPGTDEMPLSLVIDRSGIYYDATSGSDLEQLIIENASSSDPGMISRARAGMALLRDARISKYNHAPFVSPEQMGLGPVPDGGRVLVVDQTRGDASVRCGMANGASFKRMLDAAILENPGAEIIVKIHPEVVRGRKQGYLTRLRDRQVTVIGGEINPWSLIELVEKVYVVTSQLGLEALLAGRRVVCFGVPFYSGWGLTDDRVASPGRTATKVSPEHLFTAVYLKYARYICPETGLELEFEDAIAWLVKQRQCFFSNLEQCTVPAASSPASTREPAPAAMRS